MILIIATILDIVTIFPLLKKKETKKEKKNPFLGGILQQH